MCPWLQIVRLFGALLCEISVIVMSRDIQFLVSRYAQHWNINKNHIFYTCFDAIFGCIGIVFVYLRACNHVCDVAWKLSMRLCSR